MRNIYNLGVIYELERKIMIILLRFGFQESSVIFFVRQNYFLFFSHKHLTQMTRKQGCLSRKKNRKKKILFHHHHHLIKSQCHIYRILGKNLFGLGFFRKIKTNFIF